ncbi:hypothetical protein PLICRDRAFT_36846 [Plicaturopsis crispa FD-325 SS-3]|nr:hypothetical protein PLICRDRAFT_36846 [Plicaturopsis crispa FD-325 SS-3]
MTRLPPGFTHEVPTHAGQTPDVDPVTGVKVLDFDKFCCGAHGFSALIETQIGESCSHLTLFDTGPDSLSLVRNLRAMQVPLAHIETVILSHWHSDHSGGLLSFLKLRGPGCAIDLHPNRPLARGIAPGPTFDKTLFSLPVDPSFEEIAEAGGDVQLHSEGHTVADGAVWVSGEIPRLTDFEGGLLSGSRWVEHAGEGKWTREEHIMDERYAVIDVAGKGLVIFSACSHAGIVNVVKDAVAKFSRPIHMIIGGLHLAGFELLPRIPPTVDFLSRKLRPSPTYVLPMHCSGFAAKVALEEALGEGCVPAGVGHKIVVTGDREFDRRLTPPTIVP